MESSSKQTRPTINLRSAALGKGNAANHSSIRESNLALVAAEVLGTGGGLSRADLAEATGLTKATVSRLVRELLAQGIVIEGEQDRTANIGRPGTPLFPAATTLVGVGLEVNTDRISGAALDLTGTLVDGFEVAGDFIGAAPSEVFPVLGREAGQMLDRLRSNPNVKIVGATLAIPGIIEQQSHRVIFAPNLNWVDVDLLDDLLAIFANGPWYVDNDANLQAAATAAVGWNLPDPLPRSFLYLTGDMGIGGAIVRDGIIDRGPRGGAGEIGHTTIEPLGPDCDCGSQGCLERYAGKKAILQAAGLPFENSPDKLLEALERGDTKALEAVRRAGWALGIALANAVNLLEIDTVVLGTSLAPLLPWLEPSMKEQLARRVIGDAGDSVEVIAAQVQHLAAPIGGALHALESALENHL